MVRRGEAIIVVKTGKNQGKYQSGRPMAPAAVADLVTGNERLRQLCAAVTKPEGTTTDNVAADERTSVNDYELLNFNYRPGKAGSFFVVVDCDLNASYWSGCDM